MRSTSHDSLAAPARTAPSYADPGWRRSDTVLDDGLRIATFEAGRGDADAPVVLLVHGLGHWTQAAWDRLAPELAADYRIVSLDLPGFGDSSKPDIEYRLPFYAGVLRRFIEARGLGAVLLVGHSLGGLISADFARESPQSVRGLVLIDPAGFMRTPRILLRVVASRPASWFFTLRPSAGFVRRTMDQAMYDPANVSADVHERAYALALEPEVRRAFARIYAGALQEMIDLRGLHARLARYQGPVLLAWGRHDAYIPPAALRNARAVFPQAHAVIFERSGHCPNVEEPQALAAQILLFGKRAASSDGR
jgi:pimeloyl-ACP methyl ester carboxylesterase